jgi:phosphatidylinositol glycan class K
MYHLLKHHGGIPDENIILMLADEIPVNPRNPYKNAMFLETTGQQERLNLLDRSVEIDYRGDQVTVEALSRVLLGLDTPFHHDDPDDNYDSTSSDNSNTRTLNTDDQSHLILYWTGHGGDGFFKFQDVEEITAFDIHRLLQRMQATRRYAKILFVVDTCQAFTLMAPAATTTTTTTSDHTSTTTTTTLSEVYMVGSSLKGENSYAHYNDVEVGVSVIERYTYAVFDYVQRHDSIRRSSSYTTTTTRASLQEVLVDHLQYEQQRAHVGVRQDDCSRNMSQVPLTDFFANVQLQQQQQQQQQPTRLLLPPPTSTNHEAPQVVDSPLHHRRVHVSPLVQRKHKRQSNNNGLEHRRRRFKLEDIPNAWVTLNEGSVLLQPTDLSFLSMVGSFMVAVVVSSRKW